MNFNNRCVLSSAVALANDVHCSPSGLRSQEKNHLISHNSLTRGHLQSTLKGKMCDNKKQTCKAFKKLIKFLGYVLGFWMYSGSSLISCTSIAKHLFNENHGQKLGYRSNETSSVIENRVNFVPYVIFTKAKKWADYIKKALFPSQGRNKEEFLLSYLKGNFGE